ncbi:MAG: Hsp20 family protein [Acetobacterales bacterium]
MRTLDLTPLFRSTIGFDQLARVMESAAGFDSDVSYPPYNIEKTAENAYRLTMAVAGFGEDELDVTANANRLVVSGRKENGKSEDSKFLHRGIATRAFERKFDLADHIRVVGASLENGLLHIDLVREIPEAMKPRKIEIAADQKARTIEQKAA